MIIDRKAILNYESRYRATFINSLAGVKQAFLIGTKSEDGFTNLAIFNSLLHIGANPPLWGFICRPDSVRRDTLQNILDTGQYTINYIRMVDFEKAHQTSAKYEKEISEFSECGFSEMYANDFGAPFVTEAPVKVAMKFEEKIDIQINGTILIIGSIQQIDIDDHLVSPDGFVELDKAHLLSCAGLDAYYETKLLGRLGYARPGQTATKLTAL